MRQNVDVICKHSKSRIVPLVIGLKEGNKDIQAYVLKHRLVKPYGKTSIPKCKTPYPAYAICFEVTVILEEKVRTYGLMYDSRMLAWSMLY